MRWRQAGSRPREVALDEAPEPAARDDEQPNVDEVLTALAALSFNQRSAIVMRELEGRSYQEIAGVLGLSVSAVEALLFRARRNLQVRRRALGVLTTVPLPGSLRPSSEAGEEPSSPASAAVGADLVLKAAAVVAVGAATAGVGYKSVQAMTAPPRPPRAWPSAEVAPRGARRDARRHAASRPPGDRGSAAARRLRRAVAAPGSQPRLAPDRRLVGIAAPPAAARGRAAPPPAPPPRRRRRRVPVPKLRLRLRSTVAAAVPPLPPLPPPPAPATAATAAASPAPADQITLRRAARSGLLRHLSR